METAVSVGLSLICHAATAATRRAAFPLDEPLDAHGHSKAASLCNALRRVDVAMTSPAIRAQQTAAALRLDAIVDPMLADLDCGYWAGRSMEEVEADEPGSLAAWTSRTDGAPHGGESVEALIARIACWLDTTSRLQGRIVAVTHASILRAALVTVLGAAPQAFWRIDVGPLCRLHLHGRGGVWTLRSIGALRAPPADDGRARQALFDAPPP